MKIEDVFMTNNVSAKPLNVIENGLQTWVLCAAHGHPYSAALAADLKQNGHLVKWVQHESTIKDIYVLDGTPSLRFHVAKIIVYENNSHGRLLYLSDRLAHRQRDLALAAEALQDFWDERDNER